MGMEHGCKSNETMEAAVYCDPRSLIIRLTCRREREFNFSSNQLSVVNYYLLLFRDNDELLTTVGSSIYPESLIPRLSSCISLLLSLSLSLSLLLVILARVYRSMNYKRR